MNGPEAIAYIHSCHWQQHEPGLARMRALLAALGNPQTGLRFVHVAGTNGKGSTCAMLASVLQTAGYRVGLNTSPYLVSFYERIRVNGEMISPEALGALTERTQAAAETLAEQPTEFELITAVAMLYFRLCRCEIVVLEVGLGGELDASNVIDTPEVAVLAAMGMDHMAQLGGTMAQIARAKAGIIKRGGTVVSCGGCPEADAVIEQVCRDQSAQLTEVDFTRLRERTLDLSGAMFDFAPYGDLHLPLAGAYQLRNAALAITAVEALQRGGWRISDDALRRGLERVSWPGRFEVLRRSKPVVLLDGAHNSQGMGAAAESLRRLFPGKKVVLLMGVLTDKDVEPMLDAIVPLAEAAVTLTPSSPRAMGAEALRQRLLLRSVPACACVSAEEGVRTAMLAAGKDGIVCALGSLYLSSDVRAAVGKL